MTGLSTIQSYIDNAIDYPNDWPFASIIGARPSKGARSPKLWNAAFKALDRDTQMLPMDVSSDKLPNLLSVLSDNPLFLGGAVAVPHKAAVAEWLGKFLTEEARAIGTVNCLFRSKTGRLMGTNTDGEAALTSLVHKIGSIDGKKILILGGGGAGLAVAVYMAKGVGQEGKTLLACRQKFPSKDRQRGLGINRTVKWDELSKVLSSMDIVINCTTVGSVGQENYSPLTQEHLKLLTSNAVVYDIIYQPRPTKLLIMAKKLELTVIDGLRMNLEQAIIAFDYAVSQHLEANRTEEVRLSMRKA